MKIFSKTTAFALCLFICVLFALQQNTNDNNGLLAAQANVDKVVINEINAPPSLSLLSDFTLAESAHGVTKTVLFTATLSAPVANDLALGCDIYNGTMPPYAVPGIDYETAGCVPHNPVILAGRTQVTFTIGFVTLDDAIAEGTENLGVYIFEQNVVTPQADGAIASVKGVILDDGDALLLNIRASSEFEDGNNDFPALLTEHPADLKLYITGKPTQKMTFTLAITSGTAISGTDFRVDATQITIDPAKEGYQGQPNTDFYLNYSDGFYYINHQINILHDHVIEPNETFTIGLSRAENIAIGSASAIVTILNDDANLFLPKQIGIVEGNSGITILQIPYTLSQPIPSPLEIGNDQRCIIVALNPDGTESFDPPRSDFADLSPTGNSGPYGEGVGCVGDSQRKIIIPAGVTSGVFTMAVIGDVRLELNEKFALKIRTANLTYYDNISTTITITNDDSAPTILISNGQRIEGNSATANMVFTTTFSGYPMTMPVFMTYTLQSGSAQKGIDFVDTSLVISQYIALYESGPLVLTVTVPIIGETLIEKNETFSVTFGAPQIECLEYIPFPPPPRGIFNPDFCKPISIPVTNPIVIGTIIDDDTPVPTAVPPSTSPTPIPLPTLPLNEDEADFSLSANESPASPSNGQIFALVFSIGLKGERNASPALLKVTLPTGLEFVSASNLRLQNTPPEVERLTTNTDELAQAPTCTYDAGKRYIECNIGIVSQTQPVSMRVNVQAAVTGSYRYTAEILALDTRVIDAPGNNTIQRMVTISASGVNNATATPIPQPPIATLTPPKPSQSKVYLPFVPVLYIEE